MIERGSNANGEFVRFADGTLICTINQTPTLAISTASVALGFRSDPASAWTFPATFIAAPVCQITTTSGSAAIGSVSPTSLNYFFGSVSSQASAARSAHLTAIGRWF